jgi:hypothetical protein
VKARDVVGKARRGGHESERPPGGSVPAPHFSAT